MVRTLVLLTAAAMSAPSVAADSAPVPAKPAALAAGPILIPPKVPYRDPALPQPVSEVIRSGPGIDMAAIARIGSKWGQVTSTLRSVEHNRRVGGVPNSFHLSGRAIDIARRAGVRHAQIEAALRQAGFNLVESLDEGDHSHFAFGGPGQTIRTYTPKPGYQFAIERPAEPVKLASAQGGTQ